MAVVTYGSVAGLLGFLNEPDQELVVFALHQLNNQVDENWTEIAGSIGMMYVHSYTMKRRRATDSQQ